MWFNGKGFASLPRPAKTKSLDLKENLSMTAEQSCCWVPTGSWPTPRRAVVFEHAGGGGAQKQGTPVSPCTSSWLSPESQPGPPNFSLAKYLHPELMKSSLLPLKRSL